VSVQNISTFTWQGLPSLRKLARNKKHYWYRRTFSFLIYIGKCYYFLVVRLSTTHIYTYNVHDITLLSLYPRSITFTNTVQNFALKTLKYFIAFFYIDKPVWCDELRYKMYNIKKTWEKMAKDIFIPTTLLCCMTSGIMWRQGSLKIEVWQDWILTINYLLCLWLEYIDLFAN